MSGSNGKLVLSRVREGVTEGRDAFKKALRDGEIPEVGILEKEHVPNALTLSIWVAPRRLKYTVEMLQDGRVRLDLADIEIERTVASL